MKRSLPTVTACAALALLVAACGGPEAPWPTRPANGLDLRLAVEPRQVTQLQPVHVTLDLFVADGLDVEFTPEIAGTDFKVQRRSEPPVRRFDGQWTRWSFELRALRGPATLEVPGFRAATKDGSVAATTDAASIEITSALAATGTPPGEPDLANELTTSVETMGDLLPPPPDGRWLWWSLAALLPLSLAVWWWRRSGPARRQHAEVALAPHVRALRELERLRTAPRRTATEIGAFYVGVSQVLRDYLEARFGLRAPERTTDEFLRELEAGDGLAREHRGALEVFLRQCDLVKFAAVVPNDDEHLRTFAMATAFIEATASDRQAVAQRAEAHS